MNLGKAVVWKAAQEACRGLTLDHAAMANDENFRRGVMNGIVVALQLADHIFVGQIDDAFDEMADESWSMKSQAASETPMVLQSTVPYSWG